MQLTFSQVYIGAVNKLYQLGSGLKLEVVLEDGPAPDSPFCTRLELNSTYFDCPPRVGISITQRLSFSNVFFHYQVDLSMTDNVNKALVIDYNNSRLISCGSLFQGICTMRSLGNISLVDEIVEEFIVANTAEASTVAFIATKRSRAIRKSGPIQLKIFLHDSKPLCSSQVLYVGVTHTSNSPYRSEVPSVSSRSLESENLLEAANDSITSGTRMFFNSLARDRYPVNYIYGFSSGGFSYFLTTQKLASSSPFHSRLVRVCQSDPDYYSYTEVPIECAGNFLKLFITICY